MQDNTSEIEVIKRVKIVGDISTVVVSVTAGEIILKNIGDLPFIERVIIFTEFSIEKVGDLIDKFRALGIESLSFEELEELGKKFPAELIKPSEDDIAVVLFTSGIDLITAVLGRVRFSLLVYRNNYGGHGSEDST